MLRNMKKINKKKNSQSGEVCILSWDTYFAMFFALVWTPSLWGSMLIGEERFQWVKMNSDQKS